MHVTLVGLPLSGKTTVFNALTGQEQATGPAAGRPESHRAVVPVPDARLERLKAIFDPQKLTPAEVQFVDLVGIPEGAAQEGLPPQILAAIGEADALVHVVRAFENPRAPHPAGSVDPARDLELLDTEFLLTDLGIVERRLERLEQEIPKLPRSEREIQEREQALLQRLRTALAGGTPLRDLELGPAELKSLHGFNLLTLRPVLILFNVGEESLDHMGRLQHELGPAYIHQSMDMVEICAQWEMELGQLPPAEAAEFRQELGLSEPATARIIRLAYKLLGLLTFFTFVSEQVRAWPLRRGSSAVEAAGAVHTDMARGFIRAEVVSLAALDQAGSIAEARRQGILRSEGRHYQVQDGDVCTFLFNPTKSVDR
ncbi:MAG: redox-regulated ATPase YchF [Chloroflexia bacterium]|nr:redox-regulated ATPase YchF [Chloroflexia bacterium]